MQEIIEPDAFVWRNLKRESEGEWTNISLRIKKGTRICIYRGIGFRNVSIATSTKSKLKCYKENLFVAWRKQKKDSKNWN